MRLRQVAIAAAAVVMAAGAGCRRSPEPPLQAPAGPSMAERVQVLNADVYVIDGRHVRLAGAVTPQPIPDARCWAEALAARQATAAVRELLRGARDLRVQPTGRTDAYNRAIARVIVDNQDLTRTLHDAGMAAETEGRFNWCGPISEGGEGAPELKSLMDFSRG